MRISEELVQAYGETCYRICSENMNFDIFVGKTNESFTLWCKKNHIMSWAIITASNPYSEVRMGEDNKELNGLLTFTIEMMDLSYESAIGLPKDDSWEAEESLFIKNISIKDAMFLGKKFSQHALIYGTIGQSAQLLWCT